MFFMESMLFFHWFLRIKNTSTNTYIHPLDTVTNRVKYESWKKSQRIIITIRRTLRSSSSSARCSPLLDIGLSQPTTTTSMVSVVSKFKVKSKSSLSGEAYVHQWIVKSWWIRAWGGSKGSAHLYFLSWMFPITAISQNNSVQEVQVMK